MIFQINDELLFNNISSQIFRGQLDDDYHQEIEPVTERELARYTKDNHYPTLIFLSATNCNLRCKYCYAESGTYDQQSQIRQMTFNGYKESYIRFKTLHGRIKAISFFGGEPLLNFPAMREFVIWLNQSEADHELPSLSVNSNGTILNDEILNFLIEYNIGVGTSIDGPKNLHDRNRITVKHTGTYDTVIDNVKKMLAHDIKVMAQFTFSRQHIEAYQPGELKQWYQELESLGLVSYEMIPVSSNDATFKIDLENNELREKYIQYTEETCDYYIDKIKRGEAIGVPRMFIGLLLRIMGKRVHHDCSAGFSVTITPDLTVYPCHCFSMSKKFGVDLLTVDSIDDLEKNRYFQAAKQAMRINTKACQACLCRSICGSWCRGLNYTYHEDMYKNLSERCLMMRIYTKRLIEFLVYDYKENKEAINQALIAYNEYQVEVAN